MPPVEFKYTKTKENVKSVSIITYVVDVEAALYQMLGDEWISGNELSRLYEEKYGNPFNLSHVEALKAVEGLIYVKFRQ